MNDAEKVYYPTHPEVVESVKATVSKAEKETVNRFGRSGHNDESDAFRHAYASALLTRELGHRRAEGVTTAHERDPKNPIQERRMDMYNNRIGRIIGNRNRGASDQELADLVEGALNSGKLMVIAPRR